MIHSVWFFYGPQCWFLYDPRCVVLLWSTVLLLTKDFSLLSKLCGLFFHSWTEAKNLERSISNLSHKCIPLSEQRSQDANRYQTLFCLVEIRLRNVPLTSVILRFFWRPPYQYPYLQTRSFVNSSQIANGRVSPRLGWTSLRWKKIMFQVREMLLSLTGWLCPAQAKVARWPEKWWKWYWHYLREVRQVI